MIRVGITPDVFDPSGRTIYDSAALSLLDSPRIEWEYLKTAERVFSPETAARYDVLCVMLGRVTAETFARGDHRLRLIARFGVGYDTIDVAACNANGVMIAIAPDGVRRPVATNVITFVLALAQKLLIKDRLTRAGEWSQRGAHLGMGLTGRTLGAIGLGNIGAEVFRLAAPFEMRHLAYDPYADASLAASLGVTLVDLDALLRQADFVCVMCPLNDQTRGLIGRRELALMKPTAYLVNTARGPIVDERALYDALTQKRIAGAGLDVFEVEPTPADNPILRLDNVVVTPHALCFTDECLTGLARSAFAAARTFADGRVPAHVVNLAALDHAALAKLVRGSPAQ
jgi:D-3-phosphoglycerate dehydrogenase